MDILQLISHKLDKTGITLDELDIQIALEEVDQTIKNYCHIDCIPDGLFYVRANMVVDYLKYDEANKPSEEGDAGLSTAKVGPITSIKSGEVSYQFANTSGDKGNIANAHIADLDKVLHNYEYQLNNFRRLP